MIKLNESYINALGKYRFIDLFSGIGGFHLALSSFGAKCVYASEIDNNASIVYEMNFGIKPQGDIKKIDIINIPNHDILCAGFPCQPFSISGSQEGFNDKKSGDLFFDIVNILKIHQPKIVLLENVSNIKSHDNGNTFKIITEKLNESNYEVFSDILCSSDFGIPQSRKRLYIIAFHKDLKIKSFDFPIKTMNSVSLSDILLNDSLIDDKYYIKREFKIRDNIDKLVESSIRPSIRIGDIGEGRQGERIYSIHGCSTTLSASGGGLGGKTGLYYKNGKVRRLTPRECARVMGFPDDYILSQHDTQAYKQMGNSVVVDMIQRITIEIVNTLRRKNE